MVGVPPSASVAETSQVRSLDVVTPVAGLTEMASMEGFVFWTVTEVLSVSVAPWVSVAVAVQVMVSLGDAVVVVSVTESLVPKDVLCVSLVQA